jgi:hypothetical protein
MGGFSLMFFLLELMETRESLAALQQKGKQKRGKTVNQTKERRKCELDGRKKFSRNSLDACQRKKRYGRSSRQTGPDSQEDSKKTYQEQQQPFWPPRDLISD